MKKRVFLLLCLLLSVVTTWAQQQKLDVIVKKDGEKIDCIVLQANDKEVFYRLADMPENVFKSLTADQLAIILFKDGKVQMFNQAAPTPGTNQPTPAGGATWGDKLGANTQPQQNSTEMYQKGMADSKLFYKKHKGAATGTLLVSMLINPLFGLIPAVSCLGTPKDANLGIPPSTYGSDPFYMAGYREGAKKKKRSKIWLNYGIGSAISIGIILLSNQ